MQCAMEIKGKKLLLLGGGPQQVVAIETAKRLGLYTIVCDYLPDNPGQYCANRFYPISSTDKEAVLGIAQNEKIDGIIAYASDPAAPTAAYVAKELGLPGNPYNSIITACNKDLFRDFLEQNGYSVPKHHDYTERQSALLAIDKVDYPIVIKPVDASGSKGVTVVRGKEQFSESVEFAFSRSRSEHIIVEKFIEKKHKYLIGGDLFVLGGKVVMWGLMNCHRDPYVNQLVPIGKSYPASISDVDLEHVKDTLQTLVEKLGYISGPMNVELMIDDSDRVWIIDIGPRAGGNMIPQLMDMIFGVDTVEMSVRLAMGQKVDYHEKTNEHCYATYNIHSREDGLFDSIEYDETVKIHIIRQHIYVKPGEKVRYFSDSAAVLGVIFMRFDNKKQMNEVMDDIYSKIIVKTKTHV